MKCFKHGLGLFAVSVVLAQYPTQDARAIEHVTKWPAVQCRPVGCLYEMDIVIGAPSDRAVGNLAATVTQRVLYQNTMLEPVHFLDFVGPKPSTVTAAGGCAPAVSELEAVGARWGNPTTDAVRCDP
jgi:hypothetical protein